MKANDLELTPLAAAMANREEVAMFLRYEKDRRVAEANRMATVD